MLLAILVLALIGRAVRPSLMTITVLFVFDPFSLVASAVQMRVNSLTMSLVLSPHSIVNIAVGVNQSTMPVGLIIFPVSFVHGTIGPDLYAAALSNLRAFNPLASVPCPIFHDC